MPNEPSTARDWKSVARALRIEIPEAQVDRIAPILDDLLDRVEPALDRDLSLEEPIYVFRPGLKQER